MRAARSCTIAAARLYELGFRGCFASCCMGTFFLRLPLWGARGGEHRGNSTYSLACRRRDTCLIVNKGPPLGRVRGLAGSLTG